MTDNDTREEYTTYYADGSRQASIIRADESDDPGASRDLWYVNVEVHENEDGTWTQDFTKLCEKYFRRMLTSLEVKGVRRCQGATTAYLSVIVHPSSIRRAEIKRENAEKTLKDYPNQINALHHVITVLGEAIALERDTALGPNVSWAVIASAQTHIERIQRGEYS